MSEKNTGGPAFPREDYQTNGNNGKLGQEGMTLRDYFAAKADIPWREAYEHAIGRLSNEGTYLGEVPFEEMAKSRALLRYIEADAMLKARQA
jgi:argininosuccinate lyase